MSEIEKYINKKIKLAEFVNDEIIITFDDDVKIKIIDDGQSCCESRYMTTDDDVSWLNGKIFTGIEIKDAPDIDNNDYNVHEIQFLEINTNEGSVTFATHNKHNGNYGGFNIKIKAAVNLQKKIIDKVKNISYCVVLANDLNEFFSNKFEFENFIKDNDFEVEVDSKIHKTIRIKKRK